MKKYISYIIASLALGSCLTACHNEDDVDLSISVIKDSQTPQNDLDRWLDANYVKPYNIELRYRWEDNETSMDYILVPPTYDNSIRMARILKYICFESFDKVTGSTEFIRAHFPKLVHLVGNPGWNTNGGWMAQGSYTLGSSEGGYKINLWYVNHLSDMVYENWVPVGTVIEDRAELNSVFFHTIIHEFGHVFHQKIPYTTEFNQITGDGYLGGMWTSKYTSATDPQIYASGFVTAYSAYSADEDFAEIFSTYVCSTPEEFQAILDQAGKKGHDMITAKLAIVKDYLKKNWNLDIEDLRTEVQAREANLTNVNFDTLN
ncbi:MAG: putative zinc-binding metallopeptidase [Muribaculaceae bacterium]|nr:putative zinc-binding metallopeptidase [Muribaculaceae bacterium]